jgi:hypothetical protein
MSVRSRITAGAVLAMLGAGSGCSLLTSTDGLAGGDTDGGGAGTNEAGAGGDATSGVDGADGALGDGGSEAAAKYAFTDDFNRPDTTTGVGNGWNEKTVGFRLSGGEAERFDANSGDYRDTMMTRPVAETVGDVEVGVEFRFKVGGGGYVQVHARVQTALLAQPGRLDSYILFRNLNVADDKTFTIARQLGTDTFVTLKDFQSASPIDTTNRYRIRLRATGASPVELAAFVEVKRDTGWDQLATATVTDDAANRIASPGVVGLSAGNDPTGVFAYDNFSAQGL